MDFRANGKLMISGEYLVLSGARALAVPVKYGQTLTIAEKKTVKPSVDWTTYEKGSKWLHIHFEGITLAPNHDQGLSANKKNAAEFIRMLLLNAREMNPDFLNGTYAYDVTSEVEFDMSWGLGSSSSLIANIARWANVNPYQLLFSVSEGSGYDIACALHSKPLLYRYNGREGEPQVETVHFNPGFAQQLFFVYSGNKQDTAKEIRAFNPKNVPGKDVDTITNITEEMAVSTDLIRFMQLMQTHEEIIARHTGTTPVQQLLFFDFPGSIKSLGAWGGDFMLAAAEILPKDIISYFRNKGYSIIIPFKDMLLTTTKL